MKNLFIILVILFTVVATGFTQGPPVTVSARHILISYAGSATQSDVSISKEDALAKIMEINEMRESAPFPRIKASAGSLCCRLSCSRNPHPPGSG